MSQLGIECKTQSGYSQYTIRMGKGRRQQRRAVKVSWTTGFENEGAKNIQLHNVCMLQRLHRKLIPLGRRDTPVLSSLLGYWSTSRQDNLHKRAIPLFAMTNAFQQDILCKQLEM